MSELPYRETKIVELAREIAMDINELPDILKAYGIEPQEFDRLKEDDFFKSTLDSFLSEWNSATNAERRVRFKAQASIELALLDLHKAATDTAHPLNHRVLAMQFIAKLGGLGQEEKQAVAGGPGFSITINMGNQPLTIEGTAKQIEP